jgi:diacylglycerol kinase
MRIHVVLASTVVVLAAWLGLSPVETGLLVLCMAAVLGAELLNTAVEVIVDLQVGDNRHALAGRAKDLSAAAVLVVAAGAAVVGLIVLGPPVAVDLGVARIRPMTLARAGTLLTILAVALIAVRRTGERTADRGKESGEPS